MTRRYSFAVLVSVENIGVKGITPRIITPATAPAKMEVLESFLPYSFAFSSSPCPRRLPTIMPLAVAMPVQKQITRFLTMFAMEFAAAASLPM